MNINLAKNDRKEDNKNLDAQCSEGNKYYHGHGVKQDYKLALLCYMKAADHGHGLAQGNIGWMYECGEGVAQNYQEALKWYRKAADRGIAIASCHVGRMYENGLGVAKDMDVAIVWYKKGAAQGDVVAKSHLWRLRNALQLLPKSSPSIQNVTSYTPDLGANNGLWEDIKLHAGEAYNTGDANAGWKLVKEVVGFGAIVVLIAQIGVIVFGGPVPPVIGAAFTKLLKLYTTLNANQRRQVRACINAVRTGFNFFRK